MSGNRRKQRVRLDFTSRECREAVGRVIGGARKRPGVLESVYLETIADFKASAEYD
jgi:hypothetical protein